MGPFSTHSPSYAAPSGARSNGFKSGVTAFAVIALLSTLLIIAPAGRGSASTTTITVFRPVPNPPYPIGTADSSEPSGEAPPAPTALAGYTQSYVSDFTGSTLPAGWNVYTGIPGGDPGGHFGGSHVVVSGGLLTLNTYRDAAWNNQYVTGGLCQCGLAQTYGAYFVRSRLTGRGPNEVDLLWPAANAWPPEIDFSETGGSDNSTTGTVHYGAANNMDHRKVMINMTQWHTVGVIWTPTSLTFVVDGQVWARDNVISHIPKQPM